MENATYVHIISDTLFHHLHFQITWQPSKLTFKCYIDPYQSCFSLKTIPCVIPSVVQPCLTLLLASVSFSCCSKQPVWPHDLIQLQMFNSHLKQQPRVSQATLTCFSPHCCHFNCQVIANTVSPCIILVPCQTQCVFFVPSVPPEVCGNGSLYASISCWTLKVCAGEATCRAC